MNKLKLHINFYGRILKDLRRFLKRGDEANILIRQIEHDDKLSRFMLSLITKECE